MPYTYMVKINTIDWYGRVSIMGNTAIRYDKNENRHGDSLNIDHLIAV